MRFRHFGECLLATFVLATPSLAQKKALTQADWDRWRSIQGATLSNDGKWVAYTLSPQVGDGEFVVRSTTARRDFTAAGTGPPGVPRCIRACGWRHLW